MGRGNLLSLLPDFSEGAPSVAEPQPPGFEPLVREAAERPEFQSIDLPTYFAGEEPQDDLTALIPEDGDGLDLDIGELGFDFDGPSLDELPDAIDITGEPDAGSGPDSLDESEIAETPAQLEFAGDEADIASGEGPAQGALDALQSSHQEEIAQLETVYQAALQDLVETAIPKAKTEIVEAIAAELVPLLAGHLRASIADKMVTALVKEIGDILAESDPVTFELHGPEPLLLAFREQWQEKSALPKLVASDGIDLVARIDRSVLATRMSDIDRLMQEIAA